MKEVTIKLSKGTKAICIAAIIVYGTASIAKVSSSIGVVDHVLNWTSKFYKDSMDSMKRMF